MISIEEVYRKINANEYETKLPFVPRRENEELNKAYREDSQRLSEDFRREALEAVRLTNNPKASDAYALAWLYGHSAGFSEVFHYLIDLAGLCAQDNRLDRIRDIMFPNGDTEHECGADELGKIANVLREV